MYRSFCSATIEVKTIDISFAVLKCLRVELWGRERVRNDESVQVLGNNSPPYLIIEHVSQSWFRQGRKVWIDSDSRND